MTQRPFPKLVCGAACVALAFSQINCGVEIKEIPLLKPFRYVRFKALDEVTLAVSDDSMVSDLCNLDVFAGLKPDLTKEEAEVLLGSSSGSRLERAGDDEVHLFPREDGVIEIVRQRVASSDGTSSSYRWIVRFAPLDTKIENFLDARVVNLLRVAEFSEEFSFLIFNSATYVQLDVEDSNVKRIWWLHDEVAAPNRNRMPNRVPGR